MIKNKIFIKVMIIILLLFIAVMQTSDYFQKDGVIEEPEQLNTEKIITKLDVEPQVVDNLEFLLVTYIYDPNKNTSGLTFNIKNISEDIFELERFKVIIKDRNGNKLAESNNEIIVDLNYNESVDYSIKLDGNVFDDGKFKLEFIPNYEL